MAIDGDFPFSEPSFELMAILEINSDDLERVDVAAFLDTLIFDDGPGERH